MTLYSNARHSWWLAKVEKLWLVSKWWQINLKTRMIIWNLSRTLKLIQTLQLRTSVSHVSTELKQLHWFTATVYPALWNSRCSKYFCNLACFRAQTPKADSLFNSQNLYLTWYTITGSKGELICTVLVWTSLLVATGFVKMLLLLLQHQITFDWHPHPAVIGKQYGQRHCLSPRFFPAPTLSFYSEATHCIKIKCTMQNPWPSAGAVLKNLPASL